MIAVTLNGPFQNMAGTKNLLLDIPDGITAGKAILTIVEKFPNLRPFWVTEDGDLSEHVLVILDGKVIFDHPEGLQTPLRDGDQLSFFSPLAGG